MPSTRVRSNAAWSGLKKNGADKTGGLRAVGKPEIVDDYERMRGIALDSLNRQPGAAPGLALFLRQGMAAWIGAWSDCASPSQRPSEADLAATSTPSVLPLGLQSQLVMILAEMILMRHGKEISS